MIKKLYCKNHISEEKRVKNRFCSTENKALQIESEVREEVELKVKPSSVKLKVLQGVTPVRQISKGVVNKHKQSNCGAPEHTFFLRKECTTR